VPDDQTIAEVISPRTRARDDQPAAGGHQPEQAGVRRSARRRSHQPEQAGARRSARRRSHWPEARDDETTAEVITPSGQGPDDQPSAEVVSPDRQAPDGEKSVDVITPGGQAPDERTTAEIIGLVRRMLDDQTITEVIGPSEPVPDDQTVAGSHQSGQAGAGRSARRRSQWPEARHDQTMAEVITPSGRGPDDQPSAEVVSPSRQAADDQTTAVVNSPGTQTPDDQSKKSPARKRIKIWGKAAIAIFAGVPSAIIATWILAALLVLIFHRHGLDLDAISVPETLSKAGFTSEVATQHLRDAIILVQSRAETNRAKTGEEINEEIASITMPKTGLSLQSVAAALHDLLFGSQHKVSGEFVQLGSGILLRLRYNGKVIFSETAKDGDAGAADALLGTVLQGGAFRVVEEIHNSVK
jgi:hypothetical protein